MNKASRAVRGYQSLPLIRAQVLLYSTVKVWPAAEVTSKAKIPPLQVAFVSVSGPADKVVKVPPVNPLSATPARFWPFCTFHKIFRFGGNGAFGVQVSTVLPALHEEEMSRWA